MKFHWTKLLPKVAGIKHWSKTIMYTTHISDPGQGGKGFTIHPSDEAFVCVCFDNNEKTWPYKFDCAAKNSPPDPQQIKLGAKPHGPKYSDGNSGQSAFGGWTDEGKMAFDKCKKAIAEARDTPENKKWEAHILALIREDEDIEGKEAKRRNKRRKVVDNSEQPYEIDCDIEDSDDETVGDE